MALARNRQRLRDGSYRNDNFDTALACGTRKWSGSLCGIVEKCPTHSPTPAQSPARSKSRNALAHRLSGTHWGTGVSYRLVAG